MYTQYEKKIEVKKVLPPIFYISKKITHIKKKYWLDQNFHKIYLFSTLNYKNRVKFNKIKF